MTNHISKPKLQPLSNHLPWTYTQCHYRKETNEPYHKAVSRSIVGMIEQPSLSDALNDLKETDLQR